MLRVDQVLAQAQEFHRQGDYARAVTLYNDLLNVAPDSWQILYLLGDCAIRMGCTGLGVVLLSKSIEIQPTPHALTALGCAHKMEARDAPAEAAWMRGLELEQSAELYNNLASLHSDHGRPSKALEFIAKAEALEPNNPNVLWNKALALLTRGDWEEGWKLHDTRFNKEIPTGSYKRDFGCPDWDGTPGLRVVVHGEQGVGDEIMFMSILPEVLARCESVVVEVEPRLLDLVERSFGVTAYGNEQALKAHEKPFDAQIALGSLPRLFRNADHDFPGTRYLVPNPERVAHWRRQYAALGNGLKIGVAWQGGSKTTRIADRTMAPSKLGFLKKYGQCVSLQYGDDVGMLALPAGFAFWQESNGKNLDEQVAMAAACDVIVTVPQTLVHIAGALGVPTHVLVPDTPSWRYGIAPSMPWYGSVNLHRQAIAKDWSHPLYQAEQAIAKLAEDLQNANH